MWEIDRMMKVHSENLLPVKCLAEILVVTVLVCLSMELLLEHGGLRLNYIVGRWTLSVKMMRTESLFYAVLS